MDLYVVYTVDDGYESFEYVAGIWFSESNARKDLESTKENAVAIRADSRFKKWWVEEPLDPYAPNTIAKFRLFDEAITYNEDHHTDSLLEIRVMQTGDEPDAIRRLRDPKSKNKAAKESSKTEED